MKNLIQQIRDFHNTVDEYIDALVSEHLELTKLGKIERAASVMKEIEFCKTNNDGLAETMKHIEALLQGQKEMEH